MTGENINLSPCDQFRDYIHISQAIMGIEKILHLKTSDILNLSSGQMIQLKEFVKIFWKELGGNSDKLILVRIKDPLMNKTSQKLMEI